MAKKRQDKKNKKKTAARLETLSVPNGAEAPANTFESAAKREPNVSPFTTAETGFDKIPLLGAKVARRTAEDLFDRKKMELYQSIESGLTAMIEKDPIIASAPSVQSGIKNASKQIAKLGPRIDLREHIKRDRAISLTQNVIERDFSKSYVNGAVAEYRHSEEIQNAALSMAGSSYQDLEKEKIRLTRRVSDLGRRSSKLTERLYTEEVEQDPSVAEFIKKNYENKTDAVRRLAAIDIAQSRQKKLGLNPESKLEDAYRVGQKAHTLVDRANLEKDFKEKKGLGQFSTDELKVKELEAANKLIRALEALEKNTNTTTEAIAGLKSKASQAAEELEKTQDALKVSKESGGGGGFGGLIDKLGGNPLNDLSANLHTISTGYREIQINQSNRTLENQIGFARLSNSIYNLRKGALNGDMTKLSMLSSGMLDSMQQEGEEMKSRENIARGFSLAAHTVTAIGQGIENLPKASTSASVGTEYGGPVLGAAMAINSEMAAIGPAVMAAGAEGFDMYRDISAGAAKLNRQQRDMQLAKELSEVMGDQRQQFYNYSVGMRGAAVGGGAAGAKLFEESMGNTPIPQLPIMDRLVNSRISPEQFAQMAQQGLRDQGSVFDKEQVFIARNLERSGVADMQTSMNMMSRLTNAGANNPIADMVSVLETAFTKSLDTSKALNLVIEHTAVMAERGTGGIQLGFDTTKEAARLVTAGIDMQDPVNARAQKIAASGAEKLNDIATDTSINLVAMYNTGRLAQTAGMSHNMAQNITSIDNQTMAAIWSQAQAMKNNIMDKKVQDESQRMIKNLRYNGYGGLTKGDNFDFDALEMAMQNRETAIGLYGGKGLALGQGTKIVSKQRQQLLEEIRSGKVKMTEDNQVDLDYVEKKFPDFAKSAEESYGGKDGLPGGLRTALNQEYALRHSTATAAGSNKAKMSVIGEAGSEDLKRSDDLVTAGAQEMAKQAKFAADQLGGAAKALEKINTAIQAQADKFKTNKDGEDFAKAAAESAQTFANKAADIFGEKAANHIGEFLNVHLKNVRGYEPVVPPKTDKTKNGAHS